MVYEVIFLFCKNIFEVLVKIEVFTDKNQTHDTHKKTSSQSQFGTC